MKFALHFGNNTFPDGPGAIRLARAAEAAGFDAVFAIDHVVLPADYATPYPYSPTGRLPGSDASAYPDPLVWLAYVAAATTRLRLMTGVIILPQRNPLVLAKQAATLDAMSGGRLALGIGVGWLREEFAALGVPFEGRGARADEYIGAMRALWREDSASFAGTHVRFEGVSCNPKPPAGRVPIIIGGSTAVAARRAGRLGDGFFPSIGTPGAVAPLFDVMRRAADAAGRDPGAIEIMAGCPEALPGSGQDPLAAVAARRAEGVGTIVLPVTAFLPELEGGLARFGERVIRPAATG